MLDTYKVFSPPYRSSFKFEFAMKNLLGIPWNVKSTLRSLYHKLTLIEELVINQLPRWDYYLQGKYGHCNAHRFVRQFKRFLSYSRMVGPNSVPARPWLVLILKNRARVLLVACMVRTLPTPTSRASAFRIEISGGQNSSPRKSPSCPRSIMTTDEQWMDALVTRQRYLPWRARFNSLDHRYPRSPVNCIA